MTVPPLISWIARGMLFASGAAVALAGLIYGGYEVYFIATAKKTEGEIVRFEKVATKGGWTQVPVYVYRDDSGHRWEGRGSSSSSAAIAQKLPVLFDPKAPMTSEPEYIGASWLSPLFITVWGILFAWSSVRSSRRREEPSHLREPTP